MVDKTNPHEEWSVKWLERELEIADDLVWEERFKNKKLQRYNRLILVLTVVLVVYDFAATYIIYNS